MMFSVEVSRVPFTKDADNKLRSLKAKTGITPNILCRMGFCLSIERDDVPDEILFAEKGREINRYTLLGQYESVLLGLLKVWFLKDLDVREILSPDDAFVRHMNRGVQLLWMKKDSIFVM